MIRRIGPNRLRDWEGFVAAFDSVVAVVAVLSVDDVADVVLGRAVTAVSDEAVVALDVVAGGGVGVALAVSVVTVWAVVVVEGGAGAGFRTFGAGVGGGVFWTGGGVARASRTTG
jgi:hypothetical protein